MDSVKLYFDKLLMIFLLIFFLNKNTVAQKYNTIFNLSVKRVGLEFKMPKGFKELDSVTNVICGDGKLPMATVIYSLVNQDSSIVIGFSNLIDKNRNKHTANYNPIENVLIGKKLYADTISNTAFFYSKDYSKKNFNADISGEFSRNCPNPFMLKYYQNRRVFIARADIGEASITYYYNENRKKDIDKIIKQTAGMLRFAK